MPVRNDSYSKDVYSWEDLSRMIDQMGFSRLSKQKNRAKGILKGPFHCQSYPGGLSMHYGSTLELQDSSNSSELPAGISFNLTFEGNVSFALSGKRYQLRSQENNEEPECCAIIVKKPEVLTRFLSRNSKVTKLNLFIEKTWLEARCKDSDRNQLEKIFRISNTVNYWAPSLSLLNFAKTLLKASSKSSLTQKLGGESIALSLAELFISELLETAEQLEEDSELELSLREDSLHTLLLQIWTPDMSLAELAENMHMSASTLQRRFKESYGMTVMDYLRKRGLEKARICLIEQDISVGEAAFMAGYQYPSNFISAFKRCFGLTPKQLQDAHSLV